MTDTTISFLVAILLILAYGFLTGTPTQTSAAVSFAPLTPLQKLTTSNPVGSSGNYYKSDGSLTGSAITNDPNTWPGADAYDNICTAVALAEGYNQGAGTAPYDLNNPGDLSPGDENGQPMCGPAQFHGGSNIILFCTVEAGWTALRHKFVNIVTGGSSVYASTDTWAIVANKYAGNSAAWLANVTNYLGVSTDSTPVDYVNATAG
jgi:hypothetical protein